MATIVDFPDTPKYTIKSVSNQTGILPVTLRAWERRHEILSPHRSENRYRLYSEREVAILRWIKSRIDNGIPISSAVSELHTLARQGIWPEAVPALPGTQPVGNALAPDQYARQLYQLLIHHDESPAGDLLREAHTNFDLGTICNDIITPALVQLGEAWYRGEIRITTEHFASAYIRGRLLSMLQAYPSRKNAPYILCGCAPTEQHEIGALMLSVMLRSKGFRVEFLGPDVPIDDLVEYARFEHPQLILLSTTMRNSVSELFRLDEKLNKVRPKPHFGYGGAAFNQDPDLQGQLAGTFLGETLNAAVAKISEILTVSPPVKEKLTRTN
ncbi:MAG: cobalamin-dependent protein [Anaerolineaceae bacterium]|nr:cobalamin-dependent protein [Anaerolineaceae bacterium]